jgi:hypothetical protein
VRFLKRVMKRYILLLFVALSASLFSQENTDTLPVDTSMDSLDFGIEPDSLGQEMAGDTSAYYFNVDSSDSDFLVDESLLIDSGDTSEVDIVDAGTSQGIPIDVEVIGAALVGYTAGLDLGYPAYKHGGLGAGFDQSSFAYGVVVNTPYGAVIGPFEIGFGAQWGRFKFSSSTSTNEVSGIYLLGTANTSIYETSHGTVSTQVGAGYYGASIGVTAGLAFDYAFHELPLVVKPYIRANATLNSGVVTGEPGDTPSYSWINIGIMGSYDISTLF